MVEPLSGQDMPEGSFIFSPSEGQVLCQNILSDHLPYHPHDVQIKGICKLLDGVDSFAILRTGMEKTGFLSMYMLVLLEILKCPNLCPTAAKKFPNKPCMLVVLLTKYLEHQMVCTITSYWWISQ